MARDDLRVAPQQYEGCGMQLLPHSCFSSTTKWCLLKTFKGVLNCMDDFRQLRKAFNNLDACYDETALLEIGRNYLLENHRDYYKRIRKMFEVYADGFRWSVDDFEGTIGFFWYCRCFVCGLPPKYLRSETLRIAMQKLQLDFEPCMYPQMMMKYFCVKFRPGCDYGLMHFLSDGVLEMRNYETM